MPAAAIPSETAAYYDDAAISRFYALCWGGSDIHIGMYRTGDETVAEASAAMTQYLLQKTDVRAGDRVLDIACGFGGTLRTLARMGCQARGIDISQVCIDRARRAIDEAGFSEDVEVAIGDFHAIDSDADALDAVICQESLIHSPDRPKVFAEVHRVLRLGGVFGFSDILTGEGADISMVEAAFTRLGAEAGATIADYERMVIGAGFEVVSVEERLSDIQTHYDKLAQQLSKPMEGLDGEAVARISTSLSRWQAALAGGHITWACFIARKPKTASV